VVVALAIQFPFEVLSLGLRQPTFPYYNLVRGQGDPKLCALSPLLHSKPNRGTSSITNASGGDCRTL